MLRRDEGLVTLIPEAACVGVNFEQSKSTATAVIESFKAYIEVPPFLSGYSVGDQKEEGLPSRGRMTALSVLTDATGFSGETGASSTYPTLLGLESFREPVIRGTSWCGLG